MFKKDLQQIDALILENIFTSEELIEKTASTLISAGGKRLRSILCLVSAQTINKPSQNCYYLAAAIELIHAATLLHDDVIDESHMRRGKKTANVTCGNKSSILVGDFLFSRAFELMVKTKNIDCLDILAKAASIISQGEITQLRCAKSLNLPIYNYLEIIEYKTATLFAAACQTGALSEGASEDVAYKLYEFGKNFGLMYQILDDVFDYTKKNRGKNIGDDFNEGKVTLPILLAYKIDNDKFFWHQCFGYKKTNTLSLENVQKRLYELDIFNQATTIAKQYALKALEAIKYLNFSNSEILETLIESFFIETLSTNTAP